MCAGSATRVICWRCTAWKRFTTALPPLKQSFEVIGQVTRAAAEATGLAEGTPVVGGLFDIDASAVGCGAVNAGQACIIAGTWSINEVITAEPLVDPSLFMTTLFAAPGLFLSTEASATSATNLEWFVTQCCGDERAEAKRRGVSVWEVCNEVVAGWDRAAPISSSTPSCMARMCSRLLAPVFTAWRAGTRAPTCCAPCMRGLFSAT
jgi:sugar (pentulose or hexulose) kinase